MIQEAQNGEARMLLAPRRTGLRNRRRYGGLAQDTGGAYGRSVPARASGFPYAEAARRWWWLGITCAVLGTAAAVAYLRFGPIPYQSTALILVPPAADPGANSPGSPGQARGSAENYAAQAASPYIFDLVSKALRGETGTAPAAPAAPRLSATDLLVMSQEKRLDVRVPRGANLISISATDSDSKLAHRLADTMAAVFVEDVNTRAGGDLETRRRVLEQRIEAVRQQLTGAQLQQQEQELSKELWTQRGQLLQIQAQYQQELQRQLEFDQQQAVLASAAAQPAMSREQQQRLQQLQQITNDAATARERTIRANEADQRALESSLTDLNGQLQQVRDALAGLAPSPEDAGVTLQVEQRAALLQREQDFLRQLRELRAQLVQVQAQTQLELQRPALQGTQAGGSPAQATLTPEQRQQQQELSGAAESVRGQAVAILRDQQSDLERSIAAVDIQLAQVRGALAQLPPADDPVSALQQQSEQRQASSQRAALTQRELELGREIQAKRSQLLQLQAQHQQEVLRNLEERRQSVLSLSAVAGTGSDPARAAQVAQQTRQLAGSASAARSEWLQALTTQQKDVESNIATVGGRLAAVRQAMVDHPTEGDPTVAAAFTRAYSDQLQSLTQEYARLQMNAQAATAPLIRYGTATEPLPVVRAKRTLVLGAGGGLAAGVALIYGMELWRRQRQRKLDALASVRPAPARWLGTPDGSTSAMAVAAPRATGHAMMQPFGAPESAAGGTGARGAQGADSLSANRSAPLNTPE